MKRRTKLGLALAAIGFGTIALSSCTASFCSTYDLGRMKYAFEPGITRLETGTDTWVFVGETNSYTITDVKLSVAEWVPDADNPHIGKFIFAERTFDAGYGVEVFPEKQLTDRKSVV